MALSPQILEYYYLSVDLLEVFVLRYPTFVSPITLCDINYSSCVPPLHRGSNAKRNLAEAGQLHFL